MDVFFFETSLLSVAKLAARSPFSLPVHLVHLVPVLLVLPFDVLSHLRKVWRAVIGSSAVAKSIGNVAAQASQLPQVANIPEDVRTIVTLRNLRSAGQCAGFQQFQLFVQERQDTSKITRKRLLLFLFVSHPYTRTQNRHSTSACRAAAMMLGDLGTSSFAL